MIKYKKKQEGKLAFIIDFIACDFCERKFKDKDEIAKFSYVTVQFVAENYDVDCYQECAKKIKEKGRKNYEIN